MSFLILSVDDVATIGTTVTAIDLGVVDVTIGVAHIGIFFGSSVNMRRHLNQKRDIHVNIHFLMRPNHALLLLVSFTFGTAHDLCSCIRRQCKDHTFQQHTVAVDRIVLGRLLDLA